MQCQPPPAVTLLRSGQIQQLMDLLQKACVAAHPLVLDLGGGTFGGPLGERRDLLIAPAGPQPTVNDAPVPGVDLVLTQPCVFRNGVLQLPDNTQLVVEAQGCRMEGITVSGAGDTQGG